MLKNWYAICDNDWVFDDRIKADLQLLLYISSLTAEKGYCFASNKHFSKKLNIHETNISKKIKKLQDLWFINIEYRYKWCEIVERKIRLAKIPIHDWQKHQPTISENTKDNNTSINNNSKELEESLKKEFWDPKINWILELLYKAIWIDDFKESKAWQRKYWRHMVNFIKKHWKKDFIVRLKWVLQDTFKQKNSNSIKYLYWEIKSFIHYPAVQINWEQTACREMFDLLSDIQKQKVQKIIKTWKSSYPQKELTKWVLENMINSIL